LAPVTALSWSLAELIAPSPSFGVVTAFFFSFAVLIAPFLICLAPTLFFLS
jgi:hypothetical protein